MSSDPAPAAAPAGSRSGGAPRTLDAAARAFLAHEGERAPDFSACVILVPHHHAGIALRRALSAQLPGRHVLPPRLMTLPDFAATAPGGQRAEADSLRLAQVRDFLALTGQLPARALWPAARELLDLVDQLDGAAAVPDEAILARGLANRYLTLEARLVYEVWRAFAGGAGGAGGARVYAARLQRLAQSASMPLYLLGLRRLSGVERAFLAVWQTRAPVLELPAQPPDAARRATLSAAWDALEPPLAERAAAHARTWPTSPFTGALELVAAPSLEAAAEAARDVLLRWLGAGRRDIALIAPDRVMARRLRALLERHDILARDETGWAFSTATVSHVIERWLRLIDEDAWYRDLLDLLKSPFLFADAAQARLHAARELDDAFRRHGAPAGFDGHIDLAERLGLVHAPALLRRMRAAAAPFAAGRTTLGVWNERLLQALAALGIDSALAADPVGAQLLHLLRVLTRDSAPHAQRYPRADWRQWLFQHLEEATFVDAGVTSPIRITHLGAAHTRDLEGAIVLGVGAQQLPASERAGVFNDAVRAQLGLPTAHQRHADARADLADLLARVPHVSLIWQAELDGEAAPLSPWLLRLEAFHQAAWGTSLMRRVDMGATLPASPAPPAARPAPRAPGAPARLSVSAWQSLVACPYQFWARHLLHLNERDEVPEDLDKADYGQLLHALLADFHRAHPRLADHDPARLRADLLAGGERVFAAAMGRGYLTLAWQQRWLRQVDGYLAWALAWERAGHAFEAAEAPVARTIERADGGVTLLEGRIDRVDRSERGACVLDYKTQNRATLRRKLATPGEDVQLGAYAWLADAAEAAFVALDEAPVAELGWPGDLRAAAEQEGERLRATLDALAGGAPLPAWGAPTTCAWCEMVGLCRRPHREDTPEGLAEG
jgi:ATP-dependent helicase/nuclease subunit B